MMPEPNFHPFPILTTGNLILRELRNADAKAIFRLRSDKKVSRFIKRDPLSKTKEADRFISWVNSKIEINSMIYWVISLEGSSELLGTVCLWNFASDHTSAELGYEMLPKFQGKGIMSKAVKCVVKYGFETLGLEFIEAYTHKDNKRSTQLLQKLGFVPDQNKTDQENHDNMVFCLNRSSYYPAQDSQTSRSAGYLQTTCSQPKSSISHATPTCSSTPPHILRLLRAMIPRM